MVLCVGVLFTPRITSKIIFAFTDASILFTKLPTGFVDNYQAKSLTFLIRVTWYVYFFLGVRLTKHHPEEKAMTTIITPNIGTAAKRQTLAPPTSEGIALHIQRLRSDDPDTVAKAAFELGSFGQAAVTAIEPLVELLSSTIVEIRAAAAAAVGRIHCRADISIPALVASLQDRQPMVRRYAAAGLRLFQRDDLIRYNALPVVRQATNDQDDWVSTASIACTNFISAIHDR